MARQSNTDLYYLIRSLSGGDKAYYHKMARRHTGNKTALHQQLFRMMDVAVMPNDPELRKALGGVSATQFSGLKAYLCRDILDTLVFSRRHESIPLQLQFLLLQVQYLLSCKLASLARSYYTKAWELACLHEQYDVLLKLLELKAALLEETSYREYRAQIVQDEALLQAYSGFQVQERQLRNTGQSLLLLQKSSPLRITETETTEAKALLRLLAAMPAFGGSRRLYFLHGAHCAMAGYLSGAYEAAIAAGEALLAHLQTWPHLIQAEPEAFLQGAYFLLYSDFALNLLPEATAHLALLSDIAEVQLPPGAYRQRWEIIAFNARLKVAHKTCDFAAVAGYLAQYPRIKKIAAQALPPAEQLTVATSVCISHFVLEDWAAAESILIDVREQNRAVLREDVLYFTALFYLLILYEKKDWYMLDTTIEATYHMLYARKQLRPFEKDILLFLRHLPAAYDITEKRALIESFLLRLDALRDDPVQRLYFLYFNYYGWLKSKALGISYQQYKKGELAEAGA